jgi:8-oxo-dGTP pyrophosphatase MutT (NUDIX family)
VPRERITRLQDQFAAMALQPIPEGRLRLLLAGRPCGWVDPRAAIHLVRQPTPFRQHEGDLHLEAGPAGVQARSALLMQAAIRLREAGLARHWRSEQLDVRADDGTLLATVERAACRALGIATRSVHLNGFGPDGRLVVARRAGHKASDPGMWDNLAGGMVAAGESDLQALHREAQEEAGLELPGLALRQGREWPVRRVVPEGLMIERLQVFDVELPAGFEPFNSDGEVAGFRTCTVEAVLQAIEGGEFTLEAALAMLDALARRMGPGRP